MSFSLHGLAVSPGIAIGRAQLLSHATLEVAHYVVPPKHIDAEVTRFDAALKSVRDELRALREDSSAEGAPSELTAFIDVHAMILDDPMIAQEPRRLIRERGANAEWALVQQMELLVEQFDQIEDAYLRERKADVTQVVERVVKVLTGQRVKSRKSQDDEAQILIAHDLSPADTIQFRNQHVGAFITDVGGGTSHTAIVARSLAIPAIVGLHHARQILCDDDIVIVDGTRGVVIVDPDERVLEEYRLRKSELELERSKLKRLKTARTASLDREEVWLYANIELTDDVQQARDMGADGIGLFRTEFLFMNRDELPTEDEQFEAYRSVVQAMKGKPVTIRTLDVGADKTLRGGSHRQDPNPALGLRAIRYCLSEPQMFLTQLRALLRASHYGEVQILIPMVAHLHEIEQTLLLLARAREQLRERKQKFRERVAVGSMVEVPAAALALGQFLKHLDFLSIGTNDLIQYTLAIDRADEAVAYLYDPLHPAVLRLIAQTIQAGKRAGVPVSLCGEMAGETTYTRLLLGMGLRHLSMHPAQLLEIKQEVLRCDIEMASQKVQRMLKMDEPEKLRDMLARLNGVSI